MNASRVVDPCGRGDSCGGGRARVVAFEAGVRFRARNARVLVRARLSFRRTMLRACSPSSDVDKVLVCFPPSGAGATCFSGPFAKAVGDSFRCVGVDIPGRPGARRREPLGFQTSVQEIAEAVARGIEDTYRDAEVALFGHSLGAWMAFECALALAETSSVRVSGVYVSAVRAPCLAHWLNDLDTHTPRLSTLEDSVAFWEAFDRRYGASDELKRMRDDALIFQSLREDFKVCESYEGTDRALPEEIPIVAIGIRGDCRYDESMINSWRDHGRNVRVEWFDSPDATHQHRVLLSRPEEFGAWLTREIFRAD